MTRPAIALALLASLAAQPASARSLGERMRDLPKAEWAWQGMNALDFGLTAECRARDNCVEKNPLIGSRPSPGKVIAYGAGMAVIHAAITSVLQDEAPGLVKPWLVVSIAGKGVCLGLHFERKF